MAEDPCRVLVVDDNRDSADSISELFKLVGYCVRTCYDGETAVGVAAEFEPDVCILDVGLPRMDGCALAEAIRALRDTAPLIIALTGYALPHDVARARAARFDHHIAKPPVYDELLDLIAGFCERRLPSNRRVVVSMG